MKWPCRGAMQDSAFSFNPVDRFRYVRVISRLNPRGARPSRRRSRITFGERGRVRASRRKAKKRNAACERCPSAVAAINRSDRAVARPCVDTVSHRAIRFFFSPPMSAAASIPKRTARDEWVSRVAVKRTEKKYGRE